MQDREYRVRWRWSQVLTCMVIIHLSACTADHDSVVVQRSALQQVTPTDAGATPIHNAQRTLPNDEGATMVPSIRIRTVAVNANGGIVDIDSSYLAHPRAGTPPPPEAAYAPIGSCAETPGTCPPQYPHHYSCPAHGFTLLSNCVSSGELPIVGEQHGCCQ